MTTTSEFRAWFEEQYGPRPYPLPTNEIERNAASARQEADKWDTVYQNTLAWERKRDQCLTAWNAARSSQ